MGVGGLKPEHIIMDEMKVRYYDRQGKEIDSERYSKLLRDDDYQIVQQTETPGGMVSTVWLGMDHGIGRAGPLIFETMIFGGEGYEGYMTRCATEHQAHLMHLAGLAHAWPIRVLGDEGWISPELTLDKLG